MKTFYHLKWNAWWKISWHTAFSNISFYISYHLRFYFLILYCIVSCSAAARGTSPSHFHSPAHAAAFTWHLFSQCFYTNMLQVETPAVCAACCNGHAETGQLLLGLQIALTLIYREPLHCVFQSQYPKGLRALPQAPITISLQLSVSGNFPNCA